MNDQRNPTERMMDNELGSARRYFRCQVERLAFTREGNFSTVFAAAILIFSRVSTPTTAPSRLPDMAVGVGVNLADFTAAFHGSLLLLNIVMAGVVTLSMLDLYQLEIGTVYDEG